MKKRIAFLIACLALLARGQNEIIPGGGPSTGGGGGGTGDVSSVAPSTTDNQIALFSGATGKLIKNDGALTGLLKAAAGVILPVTGTATDCVHVDGTSGPCGSGGSSHTQNTDTGTTAPSFQIDSLIGGPRIKNSSGAFLFRNAADNADANLTIGGLLNLSGGKFIPPVVAAPLPAAGLNGSLKYVVTGVAGPGRCDGTGTYVAECRSNGTTWQFVANLGDDPTTWTTGQIGTVSSVAGRGFVPFTGTGVLKTASGVLSNVTGTGTDCVLVNGTSGPCGSGGAVTAAAMIAVSATGPDGCVVPTLSGGTVAEYRYNAQTCLGAMALSFSGKHAYVPSATQTISAVSTAILANANNVSVSPSSTLTLTVTPTIADGANGDRITLCNVSTTNSITLQDEAVLAGSNIRNGGSNLTLGTRTCRNLDFRTAIGDWVVTSGAGGGGGTGDVTSSVSSSTSGQIALFNSTTGKQIGPYSGTGLIKATAGVAATVTGTSTDCVRADGSSSACYPEQSAAAGAGSGYVYWDTLPYSYVTGGASSGGPGAANQTLCFPRYMPFRLSVTRITFYVSTLGAGGTAAVGLYSITPPHPRLIHTGAKPTDAVGAQSTVVSATDLGPGWYFACMGADGTTAKFGGTTVGTGYGAAFDASTIGMAQRVNSSYSSSSGIPTDFAGGFTRTTGTAQFIPYIWIGN